MKSLLWAYGITTVPERSDNLLPRTLHSLAKAGFDKPRLFVDGCDNPTQFWAWDVSVTCRGDRIGNFGNWYLGMAELFCRNPTADRFLMFEDDIIACRGLREYLDRVTMPINGYCNLYLGGERNTILANRQPHQGWFASDQRACGALALMFDRTTVVQLLGSETFVGWRLSPQYGVMRVDGAVSMGLRCEKGRVIQEYVHTPSLVQHIGADCSVLDVVRDELGIPLSVPENAVSKHFLGEDFDARSLIAK